jgi:hypothetical protein
MACDRLGHDERIEAVGEVDAQLVLGEMASHVQRQARISRIGVQLTERQMRYD